MKASLTRPLSLGIVLASCCGAAYAANQFNPRARISPAQATAPDVLNRAADAIHAESSLARRETLQREQFLNLLIRKEDKLIVAQERTVFRVSRLSTTLDRIDGLLLLRTTGRGQLLPLAQTVRSLIRLDYSRLLQNTPRMWAGLDRESFVLGRILRGEPTAAERSRYLSTIARQTQQVNFFGRHALTPINP